MKTQELNEIRNELFPLAEIALTKLRSNFRHRANDLLAAQEDFRDGKISHEEFWAAESAMDAAILKLEAIIKSAN